ncbi:hypothetical protein MKX01_040672 [Papaver californicum]|nr:hypothetical protein MKX01_040672 [Papaver californicum]
MADINTCYRRDMPMTKSIPHEVLTEILAKVASSSLVDHLNVNQTCKFFHEAGQDDFILRHASIDELPVIQWISKAEVASFLKRCEHAQNPEALYRQGMVEFFYNNQIELGRELLQKSSDSGHKVATYVLGIIFLDSGDNQSILRGRELLNRILTKRSNNKTSRGEDVEECRKKSRRVIRQLWVNNSLNPSQCQTCNSSSCLSSQKNTNGWSSDYEDMSDCEICRCNREFSHFTKMVLGVN